jgi:hypothetical protein
LFSAEFNRRINLKAENMKLLKWLFGSRKPALNKHVVIHSITCGERDENGFADIYVNGEKTNIRMLMFTEEQSNKILKIVDKIYKENDSK